MERTSPAYCSFAQRAWPPAKEERSNVVAAENNPRTRVATAVANSYEPAVVRQGLSDLLQPLGGMERFVSRGDIVLIKPNFLLSKAVEKAVTTHPEVILAVGEAALNAGAAKVLVGDSPGFGSGLGVARKIGLAAPARDSGLQLLDFNQAAVVDNPDGIRYKRFELERTALEVDKIINLAKVKTHQQMFLTLAVKNMFGCVVGVRKGAWHFEAGRDAEIFATMLLDLHYRLRPALNILDGIVMMEGNGPGAGDPRHLGLLMASVDAVALDRIMCEVLSLPLERFHTHEAARKLDVGVHGLRQIKLVGVDPGAHSISGVKHPLMGHVGDFYSPRWAQRLARRLVEVRPVVDKKICTGCKICHQQCPADAIEMIPGKERETARIVPASCIHCYCCQEVCPEGAISPRRGLARRLIRKPT